MSDSVRGGAQLRETLATEKNVRKALTALRVALTALRAGSRAARAARAARTRTERTDVKWIKTPAHDTDEEQAQYDRNGDVPSQDLRVHTAVLAIRILDA